MAGCMYDGGTRASARVCRLHVCPHYPELRVCERAENNDLYMMDNNVCTPYATKIITPLKLLSEP